LKKPRKSKANKRGGARPGAGRKRKCVAPAIPVRMARGDLSARDRAKVYLDLAIETLAGVASAGASEAARVSAARAIIETAIGKPRTSQGTADQRQDDPDDSWGDLLDKRPAGSGRAN
jgi:hypothetical protein